MAETEPTCVRCREFYRCLEADKKTNLACPAFRLESSVKEILHNEQELLLLTAPASPEPFFNQPLSL